MLYVYHTEGMEQLKANGILGLSNDKTVDNVFDMAKKNGQIEVFLFFPISNF